MMTVRVSIEKMLGFLLSTNQKYGIIEKGKRGDTDAVSVDLGMHRL